MQRGLTEAEVQKAMSQKLRGDEIGLVGYWPFDEVCNLAYQRSKPKKAVTKKLNKTNINNAKNTIIVCLCMSSCAIIHGTHAGHLTGLGKRCG